MIVRPGDKVPTDGEVIDGESHLNESLATGESLAVYKSRGDMVIGATINKEGRLRVKATRVGGDTFLSQVIRLIDQAQGSRVPIQEFADRVTGRFVPLVILISLSSLIVWLLAGEALRPMLEWGAGFLPWVNPAAERPVLAILAAIAVLVIACPCALGLTTPTALTVGSGIGAERGILIRSGEAIQTFKDIKVIVLDKTGTITRGEPKLTEVIAAEGIDEQRLLSFASSVENASEHPDEVQAGVLPEGKVDAVQALQQKYDNHVAMVGDGINDAAALKQANVGIVIGAGADVATETADVTLVRGELTAVVDAMLLSRATFSKIEQNLIWASAYNIAAIPIAAAGLLHPMIGVVAMTASSLSVIENSVLLKRSYRKRES